MVLRIFQSRYVSSSSSMAVATRTHYACASDISRGLRLRQIPVRSPSALSRPELGCLPRRPDCSNIWDRQRQGQPEPYERDSWLHETLAPQFSRVFGRSASREFTAGVEAVRLHLACSVAGGDGDSTAGVEALRLHLACSVAGGDGDSTAGVEALRLHLACSVAGGDGDSTAGVEALRLHLASSVAGGDRAVEEVGGHSGSGPLRPC
ncbi:hypothetical protein P7K49_032741 [Saguinus oedipus]|uniref:Uncharacterized protein n=1 Tax=Saguinus oedipus TaxID=9490 RepID=A0ABQ9TPX6_SAGOE|nr:hypothetical protein P7K49_032741 [Saguinus oedipus]